jgi:acyl-CoA dehydrogenase
MMILSILATVVLLGALFYHRVSLFISSLILLAWTAALGVAGLWSAWVLVPLAIILVPFNFAPMRKSMISAPVFRGFRKVMPPMSRTEKEAIDAGTTWWEGDLFQGKPDWKKLHNYPQPRLTAEEQAFLDGPVEEACRMANDFQITHELADLPPELWAYLKEHRFFAMIIKKEYGGLEFSAYAQSRVLQKLSGVSGILAITVGVPNSLGPGELLQHYGTDEQKNHYLPRLARGQEIPCFALTSPEAGSDAGAIPDTGIVCMGEWQGQQVLGMRLTWNKRYITLAPIATVLGLAFKLSDPEKLLGGAEDLGITCALIPTTTPGVEIGRRHFPLNVPFQNGPTRGKDVFVPIDYIIGGPKMAGQGWRMLVECLSVGRGITLPSNSTGGVKSVALANFLKDDANIHAIQRAAVLLADSFKAGGKVLSCGNGGSHCDAMHFAEELTGRYRENRPGYPAIAISDVSHISCVGNDFGFNDIFSRYVEAVGREGDVLLGISTSGNSANVIKAIAAAREKGMKVITLTGKDGGKMAGTADIEIRVPHFGYADRIQEIHIKVIHILIQLIEKEMVK